MIHIRVKCDCIDIPIEAGERELVFELCLKDNATVDDILRECVGLTKLSYEELACGRVFIRDKSVLALDAPLTDGERILMLKAMAGG